MDCHAVFVKTARNDGQRKRTLSFYNDGYFVILSVATQRVARRSRSKKIHTFKMQIRTLIYGYFAFAQYDKGFEILHFATQSSV